MIVRFCLYGFLKNLRFFEAFLILALRERGADFLDIGILIAIREVAGNLSQIPSGAIADAFGRKRCMVLSMACYVVSYLVLGFSGNTWLLVMAMVFYGTADAFREGTHKALIYSWLRMNGRENDRTEVYGYTRSWSKLGSAVSALIAAALVFFTGSFSTVFLLSAVPALVNLVNLATYPAELDARRAVTGGGFQLAVKNLVEGFHEVSSKARLRRLVRDSVAVEGSYGVIKDYLQVAVQALAISLPAHFAMTGHQRTAVIGGVAYATLHFLSSRASRSAHRFESRSGGTEPAIRRLYRFLAAAMLLLGAATAGGFGWLAVALFVILGILQNLWRPIHIGRFDRDGEEKLAATTLSIESQASALSAAIWAPLIGFLIDRLKDPGVTEVPLHALWPVALTALPVAWYAFRPRPHPAV